MNENANLVTIKVLFFATTKDLVGKKEDTLHVPSVIAASDLLHLITKQYQLENLKDNVILALNEDWVDLSSTLNLKDTDEIAVIPPLSGG